MTSQAVDTDAAIAVHVTKANAWTWVALICVGLALLTMVVGYFRGDYRLFSLACAAWAGACLAKQAEAWRLRAALEST